MDLAMYFATYTLQDENCLLILTIFSYRFLIFTRQSIYQVGLAAQDRLNGPYRHDKHWGSSWIENDDP